MPEPINFEAKNDRELLIVLAQSFNSLNEQTTKLCSETESLKIIEANNREKLQKHELQLIEVVDSNSKIAQETTATLKTINILLKTHSDKLNELELIRKFFWWVVGTVGLIITMIIVFFLEHRIII